MDNLVKINNNDLETKEFKGQRVITFKEIDLVHERVEGTAKRNFNSNKSHFIENVDYFFVKPSDVEAYEIRTSEINNAGTYLITESGYLMLVKSLSDDLAWTVQRELVNKYFRVKEGQPKSSLDLLKLQVQALEEVKGEVQGVRNELEEFKEDLPLIGSEPEELQKVVRKIGTRALGGYGTTAYKDKSISTKVYKSVWKYIKDQFNVNTYKAIKRKYLDKAKEIAESYEAPFYLQEEIDILNNQGKLDV